MSPYLSYILSQCVSVSLITSDSLWVFLCVLLLFHYLSHHSLSLCNSNFFLVTTIARLQSVRCPNAFELHQFFSLILILFLSFSVSISVFLFLILNITLSTSLYFFFHHIPSSSYKYFSLTYSFSFLSYAMSIFSNFFCFFDSLSFHLLFIFKYVALALLKMKCSAYCVL